MSQKITEYNEDNVYRGLSTITGNCGKIIQVIKVKGKFIVIYEWYELKIRGKSW